MKFSQENLADVLEEMKPLIQRHYDEIAHYKDIVLDPDYDQYLKVAAAGIIRLYCARTQDGILVGYAVFFIKYNFHYKTSLQALQDIIFVDKERRGLGFMFIKYCDKKLTEEGVQLVYHHVKSKHNFGPALERIGYELVDLIYAKRLDR